MAAVELNIFCRDIHASKRIVGQHQAKVVELPLDTLFLCINDALDLGRLALVGDAIADAHFSAVRIVEQQWPPSA